MKARSKQKGHTETVIDFPPSHLRSHTNVKYLKWVRSDQRASPAAPFYFSSSSSSSLYCVIFQSRESNPSLYSRKPGKVLIEKGRRRRPVSWYRQREREAVQLELEQSHPSSYLSLSLFYSLPVMYILSLLFTFSLTFTSDWEASFEASSSQQIDVRRCGFWTKISRILLVVWPWGFFVYQFNFSFLQTYHCKEGPATYDERMLFFLLLVSIHEKSYHFRVDLAKQRSWGRLLAWSSIPFSFRSNVISALANGFVFVIALENDWSMPNKNIYIFSRNN